MNTQTESSVQQPEAEQKKDVNYSFIVQNIPFFLFLALMAILYIYNGHYADKLMRKISKTENHIKELQYEYKSIKSEVIFRSKASELAKAVEPLGLKELRTFPIVIIDSSKIKK